MISTNSTSLRPGHHHRRQLSTPAPFDAAIVPQSMSAMPTRRTHRRGQTMDYGSYGQQMPAIDRRHALKTVPELRDFFNAKSAGLPQQVRNAQQFQQSFISTGLSVPQQQYQYESSQMWSQEELKGLYSASAASTSPATTIAPALSRSASESSDRNASLQSTLYRMRQERNFAMLQGEQAAGRSRVMQQLSVQPEAMSPKMNPYLSCKIRPTTDRPRNY